MFSVRGGHCRAALEVEKSHGSAICGSSSIVTLLQRIGELFLEALLPFRCFNCDQLYRLEPIPVEARDETPIFDRLFAKFLCQSCRRDFNPIRSPFCSHCGLPFTSAEGLDHLCATCEKQPFHFVTARSAGAYNTGLQAMIHLLKYRAHAQAAIPLGRLLWSTFLYHWHPQEFDEIIPVPLHAKRLRERGFNQAALLVREWSQLAAASGLSLHEGAVVTDGLIKKAPTDPQAGLSQVQRSSNLKQAFGVAKKHDVNGKRILLVDDVMTTGATADQCAMTLLSAGAKSVAVLTLARTV
jgi:ComF family protein